MGGGSLQFPLVMRGFSPGIALEGLGQASVGTTIGVHHQDHAFRRVQTHRFTDLFHNEFTIALALRRSQALGSPGDFYRVGMDHADALEEFLKAEVEAVIETPEDGGVTMIFSPGSVEVEDLFHGAHLKRRPAALFYPRAALSSRI